MRQIAALLFVLSVVAGCGPVYAGTLDETRYCGEPKRDASGDIYTRSRVRTEFRKLYPCPSTGLTTGACPRWQVDHVRPLASCGCDAVSNMQWLPVEIKTCSGEFCKDRWERTVYTCSQGATP